MRESILSIRETNEDLKEKLFRLGSKGLSDRELLLLIMDIEPDSTREAEVQALLDRINKAKSLSDIEKTDENIDIWIRLQASLEIARRKSEKKIRAVSSPRDIYYTVRHYAGEQESLVVVMLNGAQEVIGTFAATVGTLTRSLMHPREVFAPAIEKRSAAIAIAHNHPSGNLFPSKEDIETTNKLVLSGDILGIKVIDHIIFSYDGYYSFMEHGLL